MHAARTLTAVFGAVPVAAALSAQTPASEIDVGAAEREATLQRPATAAGGVPAHDVTVGRDGMKLALGDTTINIVPTPGHAPGTLSYVFPVKDQGPTVTVAYSGGTPTGASRTNNARWDEYIESQQRIAKAAADAGATVMLLDQEHRVRAAGAAEQIRRALLGAGVRLREE